MSFLFTGFLLNVLITFGIYQTAFSLELTFELPDNQEQCFYEIVKEGENCVLEYQVVTGGNYDVDMELKSSSGKMIAKDMKKQFNRHQWKTETGGEYYFCFSNKFSTFTHKVVYFDFTSGKEEEPLDDVIRPAASALTHMESSTVGIHEQLEAIIDFQTHHRLRESQGREFAEELNERVQFWSLGEFCIILVITIGQVFVLRSFFTENRTNKAISF